MPVKFKCAETHKEFNSFEEVRLHCRALDFKACDDGGDRYCHVFQGIVLKSLIRFVVYADRVYDMEIKTINGWESLETAIPNYPNETELRREADLW